ncbi:MAG: hypothetical protein ACE5GN_07000, partial [Waddliaceae bacterium]
VAQFFSQRYGKGVGKTASLALLTAMAGFSAVYVKSLTMLFSLIFPSLSFGMLSLILVTVVVFITLRGGLVAIIHTDILSFCVIAIFLPLMAYFAWSAAEFPSMDQFSTAFPMSTTTTILPPSFVVAITLITMFTYILAPWYGQKIFAAHSETVARKSVFFAAILVFGFYACAVFAVAILRLKGMSPGSPDLALPYLLQHLMPQGWKGIGYGVFFAAAATTLSGVWSAMTSMIIGDFLEREDRGTYKRGAWITLIFAVLSYTLANTLVDQIFQKLILANIPVLALSFALLSGFYWEKASSRGALLSILTGLVWGVGVYCYYGEEGGYQWYWAIYGIPLIFLSGFVGSFLLPDRVGRLASSCAFLLFSYLQI